MGRKIYIIIVAGGSGSRMGASLPKQFLELDGVPILQRTIEKFVSAVPEAKIITVLPKSHIGTWKDMCIANALDCPQVIVEGGITRFHSVQNALKKVPDGAIVMVHDGVRPLVSVGLIRSLVEKMQTERALVPVVPVVDTLAADDGTYLDRRRIRAVQTPQVFFSEDIKEAYTRAYDISFTDDASVLMKTGIPVTFVEGERFNIKITTPEDLVLAESIRGLD